jgi:hypothetical protein
MAGKGNPCGEVIRFAADDFVGRDVIWAVRVRQCRTPRARAMIAVVKGRQLIGSAQRII